jgi:glycosyltransferase involved in cell wall biosynthesis
MEHMSQRKSHSHYKLLRHSRLKLIFMHQSQVDQLPLMLSHQNTLTWPVRLCSDHFVERCLSSPDPVGTLRIAHYSRISPMRLIDQVIDAFAFLHRQIPSSLRIAGHIEDPIYYQSLLSQLERLGLEEAVSFVDPVPLPAEDPARSQVDLVWMISLSGHIGFAALEAMAAGFPTLLLEVDPHAASFPPDPELAELICTTPQQIVKRSLDLQKDPSLFCKRQAQIMRQRFLTTKPDIDKLVAFYLGEQ